MAQPLTIVRKGDTGERGNRGEFGTHRRADGTVTLGHRDEVADHTDIDRYFDGGVDSIMHAPWAGGNIYPSYWEGHWKALPVLDMDPRGMKRMQKRLFKKHLTTTAAGAEPDKGDYPWIVRYRGEDWVLDGHHRVANAVHNGHATIPVRFLDFDR